LANSPFLIKKLRAAISQLEKKYNLISESAKEEKNVFFKEKEIGVPIWSASGGYVVCLQHNQRDTT
jgi:hypothetical protein